MYPHHKSRTSSSGTQLKERFSIFSHYLPWYTTRTLSEDTLRYTFRDLPHLWLQPNPFLASPDTCSFLLQCCLVSAKVRTVTAAVFRADVVTVPGVKVPENKTTLPITRSEEESSAISMFQNTIFPIPTHGGANKKQEHPVCWNWKHKCVSDTHVVILPAQLQHQLEEYGWNKKNFK